MWLWINNNNNNSEKKKWKIRVLIPVPPACKAGALPFELIPQTLNVALLRTIERPFFHFPLLLN